MKRNIVRLTESQLHKVIKESVKKVLREGKEVFGTQVFYPLDEIELTDEEYDMLCNILKPSYEIEFMGYVSYDAGDYNTQPSYDNNIDVTDDDGFMNDIEQIQDEDLKERLADVFENWSYETSGNLDNFVED